jgi:hypothetical protein
VNLGILVIMAEKEIEVYKEIQDPQDNLDSKDPLANLECLDLLVNRVMLDHLAQKEILVLLVPLDFKVPLVIRGLLVLKDPQD